MNKHAGIGDLETGRRSVRRRWSAHMMTLVLAGVLVFATAWQVNVDADADVSTSAGATGYDSAKNQPSYWGDDCVKTEQGLQGPRWSTPVNEGYRLVVLKSGLVNDEFYNVPADTQLSTVSGKDISHVIYCGPTPIPTTTTTTTATTTTTTTTTIAGPSSTTTPATPTTTEATTSTSTVVPTTSIDGPTSTSLPTTTTVPVAPPTLAVTGPGEMLVLAFAGIALLDLGYLVFSTQRPARARGRDD